jgi:hypothetical protein
LIDFEPDKFVGFFVSKKANGFLSAPDGSGNLFVFLQKNKKLEQTAGTAIPKKPKRCGSKKNK